jgi:type VI secretion system protein ImpI
MTITLTIDNLDSLPDGGPLTFRASSRAFEIGRDPHRDWTLPDPNRVISGRHCEIRWENGAWWLNDVSRNGTFVNGAHMRVKSPYRLQHGDRLQIGHYTLVVAIDDVPARDEPAAVHPVDPGNIWDIGQPAPPPISRRDLMPSSGRARREADFAEEYLPLPDVRPAPVAGPGPAVQPDFGVGGQRQGDPFLVESEPFASSAPHRPLSAPSAGSAPASAPAYPPVPQQSAQAAVQPRAGGDLLARIAAGAGVSPEVFASRDPGEVAEEIGTILREVVEGLSQLLKARAAAKVLARSTNRTMISAVDNNPLKFVPMPEEAIEIMFARRRAGYLDARRSIAESFADLNIHEFATYAAMQKALLRLLEDLSPEAIEKKVPQSTFGSRKAKAWDTYVTAWEAKAEAHENGMLDVFLAYFADAYEKASRRQ